MTPVPEILVVDDNPGDVNLVRESLTGTFYESRVHTVSDVTSALEYLNREGKYKTTVRPDLVILDLKLSMPSGHSFLAKLKSEPELRSIPVVVFSSSKATADITRSYELGANSYVSKPADLKRFFSAVRAIEEFWFGYASLPLRENDERSHYSHAAD